MRVDALDRAWRGLVVGDPVGGGHRTSVWAATLRGDPVVVRRSRRTERSLAWEVALLRALDRDGFAVPTVVPADDGRDAVDGYVVQRWIEGRRPESAADWRAVAAELARLHRRFARWPQRPGCRPVTELGPSSTSVDARISTLPPDVRTLVLGVFAGMRDVPVSVVHGDPCPANLRIDPVGKVQFLDWDESRVDLTWHDLVGLGVQVLPDDEHARAVRLSHAWGTANAWIAEPVEARRRLDELRRSA